MAFFPNRQTFLQLGPLTIQWYAIFIMIGALCCYKLCVRNFKKMGVDKTTCEDFFIESFVIGIAGARLWYVVFMYNELYKGRPFFDMFKVWEGGLAIQGGVIAATLYGIYFFKKRNIDFWRAADCIMPNLPIAQAIGRWGNFMNQEAHGTEVAREFLEALHLPEFVIEGMHIGSRYYHPTFLYESIGNICLFLIITFVIYKIYNRHGQLFFSYFIGYGIIRFFVEALRTDSLMLGPIRMAQLTGIIGALVGIIGIIYLMKKGQKVIEETRMKLF